MINILLVDDQTLLCEVLKTWLDVEKDIQVLGIAHNGDQAIKEVERLKPDIVLMDIDMPQMDGLKATKIISQRYAQVKVIVLSGHDDEVYLGKSLRAGAKGYLLKNTTANELVEKIRLVFNNVNLLELESSDRYLTSWQTKLELIEHKLEQGLNELENKFSQSQIERIEDLKTSNQSSWRSIRQELVGVNSQLERQIKNLRQDLDSKLSSALGDWSRQRAALQEWAVQRDEMRPSMDDYEAKNRQELISVVNPIRASFKDVDKQLSRMRNWLIASLMLALLSLGVSGYVLIELVKSSESSIIPEKNVVDP